MFQKLKDKLAEEVKQSSLKFPVSVQQLTQAVSSSASPSKLLNSEPSKEKENEDVLNESSVSDFNSEFDSSFTTIDLRSPTPNRNRRSSTSSDLFPFTNFYPLAIIYSEFDDGSSIHQFTNVSKEILYEKYRNMLQKYHKYRGRFVDMRKYCLELEREHEKIKNVLTETQDKAIRRTKELKEQCALEQTAKAHLEGVLRNELEERDLIISTLNTKIKLLKSGKDNVSVDESPKSLLDFSKNKAGCDQVHFTNSFQEVELMKAKGDTDVFSSSEKLSTEQIRAKDEEIRTNGITKAEDSPKNVAKIEEFVRQIEGQKSLLLEKQRELVSKDNEIVQLKEIRTRHENDISNLRREVSAMQDDLSDQSQIRDEISTLNKSLCQMRDALNEKDQQLKSQLETISKLRSDLTAVNTKLTDASKYQKLYEEALTSSKADKIIAEEMMKNAKNELNASQVELKNAKTTIEKYESELKANEQIVNEKQKLEQQLVEYKNNLTEVTESLEQAKKVEHELNVQTANFLEEINKLKSKEDEYLGDIRKLKEDISAFQKLDEEVKQLNVVLEESKQQSQKLLAENEAVTLENASFKERIDELHSCITQLEQSFLAKKKSLEAEQKLVEADRQKYTSWVQDQSKIAEENTNLKSENAGIVKNNEEMSEKIGKLFVENKSLQNEVELLRENKSSVSSLIEKLKEFCKIDDFSDEETILAAVPEKLAENLKKIEKLQAENDVLKAEVAETKALVGELETWRQKFEILETEKGKLEEKLTEERSKVEELENWRQKFEKLLLEKEKLEENLTEERSKVEELENWRQNYEKLLSEKETLEEKLTKEGSKIEELDNLRQKFEKLLSEKEKLEEKLTEEKSKVEELENWRQNYEKLLSEKEKLDEKLTEERSKVEELENWHQKYEKLLSEKEKLEQKLAEERSKIEELENWRQKFEKLLSQKESLEEKLSKEQNKFEELHKLAVSAETSKLSNEVENVNQHLPAETCSKQAVADLEMTAGKFHSLPTSMVDAILLIRSQLLDLKAKNAEVKTDLLEFCKLSDHLADDDLSLAHLMNVVENCATENESIHKEVLLLRKEKANLFRKIENLEKEIEDFKVEATENLHNRELFYKEKYSQEMMEIVTGYEKRLAEKDNEYESLQNKMNLRNDRENTAMYQETKEVIQNLQEELTTRQDSYSELLVKHKNEVEDKRRSKSELSDLKEQYARDLRDNDKRWRSCLDKKMDEVEEKYKEEINELTKEWTIDRKVCGRCYRVTSNGMPNKTLSNKFIEFSFIASFGNTDGVRLYGGFRGGVEVSIENMYIGRMEGGESFKQRQLDKQM
ncbi:hypothetical protein ACFE04_021577 [Oxalis oulophora]